MPTSFAQPANDVSTFVGPFGYTAGTGVLTLAPGGGARFPTLSPGAWYRVTVVEALYAYSPLATKNNYTIFDVTAVAGDVLALGGPIEGTTDRPYAAGDVVEVRVTAGTIGDLQDAFAALESTATGPQGPQGPAGATGPQGPAGPQGAAGPKGDTGATGTQGPQGPAGADGADGADGATGPAGAQGPAGATGPQGATGPGVPSGGGSGQVLTKLSSTDYDTTWATPAAGGGGSGTPGSVWRDGTGIPANTLGVDGDYYLDDATGKVYERVSGTYHQVANILGPQGATGPQGPAGATGPTGPQGPAGATGPQGTTGAQGPQGPQGATGPQGSAGTPGSVWRDGTGAPANTLGLDGDYYLDDATGKVYLRAAGAYTQVATILGPQGPTGATGPQGPQGTTGPQGSAGATGPAGPGLPAGGTTGQFPMKASGTDYNTTWHTITTSDVSGLGTAATHAATDFQAAGNYVTALTGDVTASGPGSAAATLANTAVTPGSYTNASITVDAKGRLTAASSGTGGGGTPAGSSGAIQFNNAGAFGGAAARATAGGALLTRPDPGAFGGGTYVSLVVAQQATATASAGGLLAIGRRDPALAPFVGFAGWDDGNRYIYYGGGGWGLPEANFVAFYTGADTSETPNGAEQRLLIDGPGVVTINPATRFSALDAGGTLGVRPLTTAARGLTVQANPSQAGDLIRAQDSAGNPLSGVDALGRIYLSATAGAPSGTPAVGTLVYDGTNTKLWAHAGSGSWKGFLPTDSANLAGTFAARPAAGTAGRTYRPTDGFAIQRDNGTSWDAYGPVFPWVEPPVTGWTWVNQGNATVAYEKGGVYLSATNTGTATQNYRLLTRPLPATPYTITASFLHVMGLIGTNGGNLGLCWYDGTAKVLTFNLLLDSGGQVLGAQTCTATQGGTATGIFSTTYPLALVRFLRVADDGTNLTWSVSSDGQHFEPLWSEGRTTRLVPASVGIYLNPFTPNIPIGLNLVSWKVS